MEKKYDRWNSNNYTTVLKDLEVFMQKEIIKYLPKHNKIQIPNYNSILINYYEDGNDSISAHQDNKIHLEKYPTISLLSFGETRNFILERTIKDILKRNKNEKI